MSLRRIAKLFAAQNLNQIVVIVQQLLLPPAFLHVKGTAAYADWLALSAAISYLSTFNYGLQTYTVMQMTIHYNRGELKECQQVESAGLRVLLGAFLLVACLLLVVFAMPLASWLKLSVPQFDAQMALYLLGMQVMATMFFGFFSGAYMVFGEAHRGANYGNLNQMGGVVAMTTLVLLNQPFSVVALGQFAVTMVLTAFVAWDLAKRCPDLKPTLRYWQKGSLGAILKPSSQYMLLASSNLLAYQVPVLLMKWLLSPTVVVAYSVSRTVYSMSRRLLYLVTNSLSAEITLVFGQRDWPRLHKLYSLSERIILLMTPPITFGSMIATPLLLHMWLHKSGALFVPSVCIPLGLTVSILSIKEHKYQFQFSSNNVSGIAWQTLVMYGAVSLVSIPLMKWYGVQGYLLPWLVSEVLQLFYLLHLNDKLFAGQAKLDHKPVYQLMVVLALSMVALYWPVMHIASQTFVLQGAISVAVTLVLTAICYWIFQVDELRDMLWKKFASRSTA